MIPTLRHLRRRLSLVAGLTALGASALLAGAGYLVVRTRLAEATDRVLADAVAHAFVERGQPVPPDLAAAASPDIALAPLNPPAATVPKAAGDDDSTAPARGVEDDPTQVAVTTAEAARESELAAVQLIALDAAGAVLAPGQDSLIPDQAGVQAATARGIDWRTRTLDGGIHMRILTYRGGAAAAPMFQAARLLADQDRTLATLLVVFVGMGALITIVAAAGSWWLTGLALHPAQVAWERQQTFVADASHELRTPLTLIRASVELVRRKLPAEDDHALVLDDVLDECDHTARVVDDLLLLSRLDAGTLRLAREPVDLGELLPDLVRQVGRVATERGIALDVAATGAQVLAERTRLRQVLLILLDNALKFTAAGGHVRVSTHPHDAWVDIQVSDSGIGIAAEHLDRLFDRFYRVDAARGVGGGVGLGLAIAHALVSAQGGRISVASHPGRGTQVTVRMPVGPS